MLLERIREYFNRRSNQRDAEKGATPERRTLAIQNGETAGRLLGNQDFALLFNLYRFDMLSQLEDSATDEERIRNAHYVAGVRDFVSFVEKTEYIGKLAQKNVQQTNEMG